MIIDPLTPNFMLPITANWTASSGSLGREGSSGLVPNEVGDLSPSGCRCQHGALFLYSVFDCDGLSQNGLIDGDGYDYDIVPYSL
mmetsp:Transcript_16595/g.31249  ORF Transcript_16595/g.31249 Transcript_16595/m.31249 type:complete len:85 (-) Transcript_16595:8-262(-)